MNDLVERSILFYCRHRPYWIIVVRDHLYCGLWLSPLRLRVGKAAMNALRKGFAA